MCFFNQHIVVEIIEEEVLLCIKFIHALSNWVNMAITADSAEMTHFQWTIVWNIWIID